MSEEGDKSWMDKVDIIKHPGVFVASAVIFILYTITTLIDVNGIIKNFNILDVENTTRGTLVFAYLAGYYMFILRLFVAILTILVIITILRISVILILALLTTEPQSGGGAREIKTKYGGAIKDDINNSLISNFRFFLGFITVPSLAMFIFLFLVVIPMFYLFFVYTVVKLYDQNKAIAENKQEAPRILNTFHHYMLFMMSVCIMIGIFYVLVKYLFSQKKEEAQEL